MLMQLFKHPRLVGLQGRHVTVHGLQPMLSLEHGSHTEAATLRALPIRARSPPVTATGRHISCKFIASRCSNSRQLNSRHTAAGLSLSSVSPSGALMSLAGTVKQHDRRETGHAGKVSATHLPPSLTNRRHCCWRRRKWHAASPCVTCAYAVDLKALVLRETLGCRAY